MKNKQHVHLHIYIIERRDFLFGSAANFQFLQIKFNVILMFVHSIDGAVLSDIVEITQGGKVQFLEMSQFNLVTIAEILLLKSLSFVLL